MKDPNPTTAKTLKSVALALFADLDHEQYVFFNGATMCNLHRILSDTPGDYVIFNNFSSHPLEIWHGELATVMIEQFQTKMEGSNIRAFRYNGEDTVLSEPILENRWIVWVDDRRKALDARERFLEDQELLHQLQERLMSGQSHIEAHAWYAQARERMDSKL